MVFNSYTFIVFLAVLLLVHRLPLSWNIKKTNLLLASYLFYAVWNPPFIILLWLSTIVDFQVGKTLYEENNNTRRKMLLVISLIANLGMLSYFKYGGFLLENFVALASSLGIDYNPPKADIILPVGISFYTFQTLSYTLDMYKKKNPPERSLLDFSLFVTFFPQLVAGPIVRPDQLIPQFKEPRQATRQQFTHGLFLLSLGLFMKVTLADTLLAGSADKVFGAQNLLATLDAWLGVLAFSGQIFFDFGGYSTCAIGLALLFGFVIPDNFRYPYAAIGFSDFWQRWHITLSTWLRDYLYIPLGGNRKGELRTYVNLMATMLLGGLWHGASWTFVVWGGLHGFYLCVERLLREKWAKKTSELTVEPAPGKIIIQSSFTPEFLRNAAASNFLIALFTFFLINVTWVFFRSQDFATAWRLLSSMFGFSTGGAALLTTIEMFKISIITFMLVGIHWMMRSTGVIQVMQKMQWWAVGIVWALMLILVILSQSSTSSFIYFQF